MLWSFRLVVETSRVCLPACVVLRFFICRIVDNLQLNRELLNYLLLFSVGTVCQQFVKVFYALHQCILLAVFTSVRSLSELLGTLVHSRFLLMERWLTVGLAGQHHDFPQKVFC